MTQTGVVLNRAQQYVWERGNKKTKLQMNIEDVPESIRTANWKKKELQDSLGDMGTVIDLTGCTLDNVLYEVSAQRPVIAKTGENSSVVIVGYDEYNTYLYDPATGQISPYGMNDSTALFEECRKCISHLYRKRNTSDAYRAWPDEGHGVTAGWQDGKFPFGIKSENR